MYYLQENFNKWRPHISKIQTEYTNCSQTKIIMETSWWSLMQALCRISMPPKLMNDPAHSTNGKLPSEYQNLRFKAETIISLTSLKDLRELLSKGSWSSHLPHCFRLLRPQVLTSPGVKYFTDYHFVTDLTFLLQHHPPRWIFHFQIHCRIRESLALRGSKRGHQSHSSACLTGPTYPLRCENLPGFRRYFQ